jgi:hypothetical protein
VSQKISDLYKEKYQLEQFISRYKIIATKYQVKSIADRFVNNLLTENRALTYVIIVVVQDLKEKPVNMTLF